MQHNTEAKNVINVSLKERFLQQYCKTSSTSCSILTRMSCYTQVVKCNCLLHKLLSSHSVCYLRQNTNEHTVYALDSGRIGYLFSYNFTFFFQNTGRVLQDLCTIQVHLAGN